jgi:hypothetical protein
MSSHADNSLCIQSSCDSVPATPSWFREVVLPISWLHRAQARGGSPNAHRRLSLAHSYQGLGSFGNRGNGLYKEELRQRLRAIRAYLQAHQFSPISALLRLDGQYGTGAIITDLADFSFVKLGKDYCVLDRPDSRSIVHRRPRPPPGFACESPPCSGIW